MPGRHIGCDDRTSANDRTLAQRDTWQYYGAHTNPDIVPYHYGRRPGLLSSHRNALDCISMIYAANQNPARDQAMIPNGQTRSRLVNMAAWSK